MNTLVPYSFNVVQLPKVQTPLHALPANTCQGIYFTTPGEQYEWFISKIESWFADRAEVSLIDKGISDKRGLGYIMLEWNECEIDPLFLAILKDEEMVEDYTVYIRDIEEVR